MTRLARATFIVLASGTALALAAVHLFPEKKRYRRRYSDPLLRTTAELATPKEPMREIVYGKKR